MAFPLCTVMPGHNALQKQDLKNLNLYIPVH